MAPANAAALITAYRLTSTITGLSDLPGKRVRMCLRCWADWGGGVRCGADAGRVGRRRQRGRGCV